MTSLSLLSSRTVDAVLDGPRTFLLVIPFVIALRCSHILTDNGNERQAKQPRLSIGGSSLGGVRNSVFDCHLSPDF